MVTRPPKASAPDPLPYPHISVPSALLGDGRHSDAAILRLWDRTPWETGDERPVIERSQGTAMKCEKDSQSFHFWWEGAPDPAQKGRMVLAYSVSGTTMPAWQRSVLETIERELETYLLEDRLGALREPTDKEIESFRTSVALGRCHRCRHRNEHYRGAFFVPGLCTACVPYECSNCGEPPADHVLLSDGRRKCLYEATTLWTGHPLVNVALQEAANGLSGLRRGKKKAG